MATQYVVVWNRPFSDNPFPNQTYVYANSARDAATLTACTVDDPIWCRMLFVINWDTKEIVWDLSDPWPPNEKKELWQTRSVGMKMFPEIQRSPTNS